MLKPSHEPPAQPAAAAPAAAVARSAPPAAPERVRNRAGVVGSPIGHSLSPTLHQAAYDALGLTDWAYDAHAVGGAGEPDLATFVAGLGPEWVGLSVTMPLKEDALALAVTASGHARDVGAANTLIRADGGWVADSTDAEGLLEALLQCGVTSLRSVLILGSGATARSALDAVRRLGASEVVFGVRDRPRPETVEFAHRAGLRVRSENLGDPDRLARLVEAADVTVATLPTGTRLDLPPAAADRLGGRLVMDVVYGGWPTPLARWAAAGGARVESGLPMLIHQAAAQVRLMTGRPGPAGAMRAAVGSSV